MNTMTEAIERGKCLFDLHFPVTVHHEGKSNQEVKQKPWRSAVSQLALRGLLSLLSYMPWDHLPRGGAGGNGLGPAPCIINQENTLQDCLQSL